MLVPCGVAVHVLPEASDLVAAVVATAGEGVMVGMEIGEE